MLKKRLPTNFAVQHEICSSGCYLFDPIQDAKLTICPMCSTLRTKQKFVKIVSLKDKIAQLLCSDDFRSEIEYRDDNFGDVMDDDDDNKVYTDIFSGEVYKNLQQQGLFQNVHDIALALSIDGFSSRSSRTSMVIVDAVILNLPPSIR
ncbi:hypothetical protein BDF20DRAFT_903515 [Mycotypha africana]|uniref:uncharacterized protein n=1 Tax=Mycotypha africana TaxID=64632 RepID=UPI002300F27A|nr:uncharacterized protein BDF20DRAFT_903515 [Mycotypha africana]KAI8966976.1 hypothetical protein BDF20DRAFT_903515 [Mycotypha africana]